MSWEYPQTDGDGSGATDENVMIREVLPERDKISFFSGRGAERSQHKNDFNCQRI